MVGGGALASLVTAAAFWLNGKRSAPTPRTPPLGEDVARTYVTKEDFAQCQGVCRKDIESLRQSISDNDEKAESRARGTHSRIDRVYLEQQKNNKALGMLIGIMAGKGIATASAILNFGQED